MSAGKLSERVTFSRREETNPDAPNDYGNTVSGWVEQFEVWAGLTFLRGGEGVMAGRLQGRQPVVIRVRASSVSRQVATDWKVTHRGTEYAVRSINADPEGNRAWIDVLAESGVAL